MSGGTWQYTSKAHDQIGLEWDNDDWEAQDPDEDSVGTTILFRGSGDGPDIDIKDYSSNFGVAGKVNYNNEAQQGYDTDFALTTNIYEVSSDSHVVPVGFRYRHNTAASETLSGVNVKIGPGGLVFNTSQVKKQWDKTATAGPDEFERQQ